MTPDFKSRLSIKVTCDKRQSGFVSGPRPVNFFKTTLVLLPEIAVKAPP